MVCTTKVDLQPSLSTSGSRVHQVPWKLSRIVRGWRRNIVAQSLVFFLQPRCLPMNSWRNLEPKISVYRQDFLTPLNPQNPCVVNFRSFPTQSTRPPYTHSTRVVKARKSWRVLHPRSMPPSRPARSRSHAKSDAKQHGPCRGLSDSERSFAAPGEELEQGTLKDA